MRTVCKGRRTCTWNPQFFVAFLLLEKVSQCVQISVLEQDKRNIPYLEHEDKEYRKHKSLIAIQNVAPGYQHQSCLGVDYKSRISGPIPHFSQHFHRTPNDIHKTLVQIFQERVQWDAISGIIGINAHHREFI